MNVHAMKSMADAGAAAVESAAGAVLESGGDMAAYAERQAKTVGTEVEALVRQNPLAAVGGAFVIGVLVGIFTRARVSG